MKIELFYQKYVISFGYKENIVAPWNIWAIYFLCIAKSVSFSAVALQHEIAT